MLLAFDMAVKVKGRRRPRLEAPNQADYFFSIFAFQSVWAQASAKLL